MQMYMLYESRLGDLPDGITELICFDSDLMITNARREGVGVVVRGRSVILEGSKQLFIDWLKPFDSVWVGKGQPNMEQFEICHIRDDA